ncbi:solanesyl diphosphate synthase 3, chloroplastic/mitochondrial isoform X1 [Tanacetum coccineum]|uniref:Solanesyl diphosphate synthase 3, chloroplastic/mitochondrial isoform X1 n=1 Tax=Tanacetum coccineum TaxID=301880 RepID=A0ABQ5HLU8_9ASTR
MKSVADALRDNVNAKVAKLKLGSPAGDGNIPFLQDSVDPFSLIADELSNIASRLRAAVVSEGITFLQTTLELLHIFSIYVLEIPPTSNVCCCRCQSLPQQLDIFLRVNCKNHPCGKMFRPTIILLMATALNVQISKPASGGLVNMSELRMRLQSFAEFTEMIHVASLLHDDVLDDADTRRSVGSLNSVMGNKVIFFIEIDNDLRYVVALRRDVTNIPPRDTRGQISVLAGDFLISRAFVVLASLKNTEAASVLATSLEHLVTGEIMQMSMSADQCHSMDHYMKKTYYKAASLISNSCKSIAILTDLTEDVAMLIKGQMTYRLKGELAKRVEGHQVLIVIEFFDITGTSSSLWKGFNTDIRHVDPESSGHYIVLDIGIVTAPILYAMEEFPELHTVVDRGLDSPANVELVLEYLGKSHGIQKTRELAAKHAKLAAAAIDSLPANDDENVQRSRHALIEVTCRVINRTK